MGHKHSDLKVRAKMTVHGGNGTVDGLRLSYKRKSCWCKGRRVVAAFTFPEDGWLPVSTEDIRQNKSTKGVKVPFEALRKKDGNISVRITCLAGSVPVYRTQLALGDLLEGLSRTTRGNEALLLFNLTGGTVESGAFTALFCNGRRCGEALREKTLHQRPADGKMEAEDGHGQVGCPTAEGNGQETAKGSCGIPDDYQGQESSPSPAQHDDWLEGSLSPSQDTQGQEGTPSPAHHDQGLEGSLSPSQDTQELEGSDGLGEEDKGHEDVLLFPDSHETTPHGCQYHRTFNIISATGIYLGVLGCLLVFFNAWREWMEY